jgi:hypothetical protein
LFFDDLLDFVNFGYLSNLILELLDLYFLSQNHIKDIIACIECGNILLHFGDETFGELGLGS